jgi:hypothetical protein
MNGAAGADIDRESSLDVRLGVDCRFLFGSAELRLLFL